MARPARSASTAPGSSPLPQLAAFQAASDALAALGNPPEARAYLERALADLPIAASAFAACTPAPGGTIARFHALCADAWEALPPADRKRLGQVFTPLPVVRSVLDDVGFDGATAGRILDPACGAGAFLGEAFRRVLNERALPAALAAVHGVEIDEATCGLARLNLAFLAIETGEPLAGLPVPDVRHADALDPAIAAAFAGVRWVVGNPPYLEAKQAPSADKERWRTRFSGRLEGAFDLYTCFIELALEILGEAGHLGLVVPNKFLVNRYGRSLRRRLLAHMPPRTMRDLSHLPVFRDVGVYPVTFHATGSGAATCTTIGPDGSRLDVPLAAFASTEAASTYFVPPDPVLGGLLARLLSSGGPRLGDVARFRSTVSFHAKGLREQYVSATETPGARPYLGGKSWMRRKEVAPFHVHWDGYWIRYEAEELAGRGNPLPPLELFAAPKVVFCQHARRLAAFWDAEGRFVTKDVYPIALAPVGSQDPRRDTAALAALLNSRVLSVLYAVLFRGICIGGGYYHYLPAFLEQVPVPRPTSDLADLAEALARGAGRETLAALDDLIADLYGLSSEERSAVEAYFSREAFNDDPVTAWQRGR